MNHEAGVIAAACEHLAAGEEDEAAEALRLGYPFVPLQNPGRRYTPQQMASVFVRDGFVDRYTGARLIFPPVLRIISGAFPDEFPAHPNWKMSETHVAYWDLFPTIDHLVPVARGGDDAEHNWVTTSMSRNSAKGNSLLEQIGWELHPCGDLVEWDGLGRWLLRYLEDHPEFRIGYVKTWANALEAAYPA